MLHPTEDQFAAWTADFKPSPEQKKVLIPAIIPGQDEDDAKPYLEKHIAEKINESKSSRLLDVSVRTLHKWEQHAARPSGAARTLLKLAAINPQAVRQALQTA